MVPSTDIPLVLYVEDEDDNFTIADLRLRGRFRLLRASTDREACEVVRQRGHELSAVLMDAQLRGAELDGFQLTRIFTGQPMEESLPSFARGITPLDAPVFVLTAYGELLPADADTAGVAALYPKPVNYSQLIKHLQALPPALEGAGSVAH